MAGALLMLAAAIAIAACGGGDSTSGGASNPTSASGDSTTSSGDSNGSSTTASAAPITKAELIKKADALCRKTDVIQKNTFNAYSVKHEVVLSDNPKMRKATKTILLPPITLELEEIAALGAPAGDEAQLQAILSGWERAVRTVMADPGSLVTETSESPFTKSDELAAKYGFKDCATIY